MAKKFKLADGTVGMLDDDGTFTPGAEGTAPAAQPAQAPAQSAQPEHGTAYNTLVQPFVDIGKAALSANDFAARGITHPVETFGGGKGGAVLREGMRGVNSNIPFANSAVEAMGGPPAESAEDAARAPGAQAFGGFAGAPVGGMVAKVAGVPLAAAGEASMARSAARHAITETPVKAAVGAAAKDIKEHARELAAAALLGHGTGHGTISNLYTALRVAPPLAKAGAVAADEGFASLARRFSGAGVPTRVTTEEPASMPSTPAVQPSPPQMGEREAVAASAPELTPVEKFRGGESPPEPTQRMKRQVSLKSVPAEPMTEPTIREKFATPPVVAERNFATSPKAAEPAPLHNPREAPKWEPSKYDDKYARKLKMSPEEFHDMMNGRLSRAHAIYNSPGASLEQRARAAWDLRTTSNKPIPGEELEAAE